MFTVPSATSALATSALATSALSFLLGSLLVLALMVPLVAAYWFAPALVMIHDMPPIDAMKASFFGCLRNVVPFLLYGIVMLVGAFVAALPLGLGFLICTIIMLVFSLTPNGLFWTALALSFVSILLVSTMATLLGTFLPPAVAGGVTFFVIIVQNLAATFITQPWPFVRYLGFIAYYVLPSQASEDVLGQALKSTVLDPDYSSHVMVMLENLGYSASMILVACAIFAIKEIRIR